MMAVDWVDPCARAAALREAYYKLLSGTQAYSIEYVANGVSRKAQYSVINMKLLLQELRDAEVECAEQTGVTVRRRYAIVGGSLRRPYNETE